MNQKWVIFSFFILSGIFCLSIVGINQQIIYNPQTLNEDDGNSLQTLTWDDHGNPVCTADDMQKYHDITASGNDAIIVWHDERINDSNAVYAQKVDNLGTVQWDVNGIKISNIHPNIYPHPQVCTDGDGGAILTWVDGTTVSDLDIFAQRIDENGTIKWKTSGVVICKETNHQLFPKIIRDGSGGAIIAWSDSRNGNDDIYAQRINSTGHVKWTEDGIPVCNESHNQDQSVMTSDEDGGVIIAWQDYRNDVSSGVDIYATRILKSGVKHSSWTLGGSPICIAPGDQLFPAICSDGNRGAILTWGDSRDYSDIYAARINQFGSTTWTTDGVKVSAGYQGYHPIICSDNENGAIIAFVDYKTTGTKCDIYAQKLNSTGDLQWDTVSTVCNAAEDQKELDICQDSDNGAFITWEDNRDGNSDIYVNYVNSTGFLMWTNGKSRCTQAANQRSPKICRIFSGTAILAWHDERSGAADIYAASITKYFTSGDFPGFEFIFIIIGLVFFITIHSRKKLTSIIKMKIN